MAEKITSSAELHIREAGPDDMGSATHIAENEDTLPQAQQDLENAGVVFTTEEVTKEERTKEE